MIETPIHEKNIADDTQEEVSNVIKQYQRRIADLTRDKRFKYILVFKNYGESAGTSVEHAHSQIIALPMIPKYVAEEIEGPRPIMIEISVASFVILLNKSIRIKSEY